WRWSRSSSGTRLSDDPGPDGGPMCPVGSAGESSCMIIATNLTKRYGSFVAADDVSFTCQPGTVTGFLGPNGAGKSTTLRMMVGLTPPTSGAVTVHGRRYVDLPNPAREVGVMLDASAQHPGRTGLETLKLAALLADVPSRR